MKPSTAYCVTREADGEEYIDILTIACLPELSQNMADRTNVIAPAWAAGNKQKRLIKIEIKEAGK